MKKTMKTIKKIIFAIIGLSWATISILLGVDFFMNSDKWVNIILIETGIEVSENFTAGDIAYSIVEDDYVMNVHVPVWNGLFNKSTYGFIQVEWISDLEDIEIEHYPVSLFNDGTIDGYITINVEDDTIYWESNSSTVLGIIDRASLAGMRQKYFDDNRRGIIELDNGVAVRFMIHRSSNE